MAIEYGYEGLRTAGTFKLDSTTKGTISSDPKQIIGKVVTIVDGYQVGYGADGDEPLGVVTQIEKESTNSDDFCVSVAWGQTFEGIKCAGSESAGDFLACDGSGGLKQSVDHTCCKALGVDSPSTTCTIKIN